MRRPRVFGVNEVVIKSVPELGQVVGDNTPERAIVYGSRFDDVFKDEGLGLQMCDPFKADFGSSASAFVVVDSLLFPQAGFGLAWESSNVKVDAGVVDYFGLGPGVLADFEWFKIVPDEFSGIGFELRGADKDVRDAK